MARPKSSTTANSRLSGGAKSIAVKFLLADGSNLDIVNHSFNGFPVATAAEFSILLQALGSSPPGTPSPTAFEAFLGSHPAARNFFTTQKPPPESFATTACFGVNAFYFIDAAGHVVPVRYRFVPQVGEHYLSETALKSKSPTYLVDEIAPRVAKSPVRFTWFAQVGESPDRSDDPSVAWPESRRLLKLGVITIDQSGPNTAPSDRDLLFLPGTLPPGIRIADPMVTIRNAHIRCPSISDSNVCLLPHRRRRSFVSVLHPTCMPTWIGVIRSSAACAVLVPNELKG